ncbi:MAG: glycosyltransferase, partial [Pseudomonadota bacterium]
NEVRRFDVVHAHAVFLAPQTHAIRLGARAGVPVLLAPRGMLDRELLKSRSRWIKAAWLALVERRNLSQASALHFTTRAEGVRYEELGLPRRPSRVIPNGLGLSRFVNLNEVTTLLSLRDPHELLCLGRVNWKKGLDRAIRGLAYLGEPWRLTIAGNDEEGYTPVLERLARELGVASRVRFVGEQRGEAKWSLLDRAGCLLLPSRSENFGIVVLEAMARGCPVAVTPEVGLADFVREHRAGLVIGSEPEAMAAQVAAWASNRAEVAEEVGRALSAAHSRFSWPAVASAMVEWYRELAAGRTRAA